MDLKAITASPDFQALDTNTKERVLGNFFTKNIESSSEFQVLPKEHRDGQRRIFYLR